MSHHQSHVQRLSSRPLSTPPLQSNGSIDTSSTRRLPYGLTEDLLHGFYSDDGIDETLASGGVGTSTLDHSHSISNSRRIKFMDSNIPEQLMEYDHPNNANVNVNNGSSLHSTSAANDLPPHVIDIRKALVDGDAPAAVVSYVVKAVNTYEYWIRDLWKVANNNAATTTTPSTVADVTETGDDSGGGVLNDNVHNNTLIKRYPSNRDTLTNSKRSIARLSSIQQHSLNHLPKGSSVTDILSRMEGRVNILRERIGSNNGEPVDVLLRDCQQDLAALRGLTLEVIQREAIPPRYQTVNPLYQPPAAYPATNNTPDPKPTTNAVCSPKTSSNVHSPKTVTHVVRSPKTPTNVVRTPKPTTNVVRSPMTPTKVVRSPKPASQSTIRSPVPYTFLGKPAVSAEVFRVPNDSHPNGVAVYQSRTASTMEIPSIFMKPQPRRSMWCCSTTT